MAYSGSFRASSREPRPMPALWTEHTEQPVPENTAEPLEAEVRPAPQRDRVQKQRGAFDLSNIMKTIEAAGMESDDLLMALILFLMYRESGDTDLLIMLGVMLLT